MPEAAKLTSVAKAEWLACVDPEKLMEPFMTVEAVASKLAMKESFAGAAVA